MCLRDEDKEKACGLVLEGGGLRGIFTAGVLDFFMEKGLSFPYVIGCSAGACNLLGYVAGQIGYTKRCMIQKNAKNRYYGFNQLIENQKLIDLDKIFLNILIHRIHLILTLFSVLGRGMRW